MTFLCLIFYNLIIFEQTNILRLFHIYRNYDVRRILICHFFFQSIVMLMFREEKSPEDEIKAWQFWHGRQHSVKQRILDAGPYLYFL